MARLHTWQNRGQRRRQSFGAGFTVNIQVDCQSEFYFDIFESIGVRERLKIPNPDCINFKTYVQRLKKPGFCSIHMAIGQCIGLKKPVSAPGPKLDKPAPTDLQRGGFSFTLIGQQLKKPGFWETIGFGNQKSRKKPG